MTKHKKRKTIPKCNKAYIPNTKQYILLIAIFGFITLITFIVLCLNLNCNSISIISSAIISIMGGALASVVIAWLLDISNCNNKNTFLQHQEESNVEYIHLMLNELFQSFADAYSTFSQDESKDTALWDVWFRKLSKNNFFITKSSFYDEMLATYVSLNDIIALVDRMNNGEVYEYSSRKSGVQLSSELLILKDTCCKIRDKIFWNSSSNNKVDIEHIIFTMNDVLSTIIAFIDLGNKQYCSIISKQDEHKKQLQ